MSRNVQLCQYCGQNTIHSISFFSSHPSYTFIHIPSFSSHSSHLLILIPSLSYLYSHILILIQPFLFCIQFHLTFHLFFCHPTFVIGVSHPILHIYQSFVILALVCQNLLISHPVNPPDRFVLFNRRWRGREEEGRGGDKSLKMSLTTHAKNDRNPLWSLGTP